MTTPLYFGVRAVAAETLIGGSSADFLQFEVGGRSAGMAGAHTGVATGVTAQFWNPALLASLQNPELGALHASWLQDLSYEWVGYARPVGSNLGVGSASIAYFHMPSIQGVDEFNNPTQSFSVYDLAATVGLARPVSRNVNLGANVKMIRQNLATVSAAGVAADFGVAVMAVGGTLGLAVQNVGPSLAYGDASSYPLPRQIRVGASRSFVDSKLLVALDYNSPQNYYDDVRVGTEFKAHRNVSIRLGYRKELGTSSDPATGISYGLGLHFGQVAMDYAMTPSSDFDNVQRFALGYSFGGGAEEKPEKPEPPKKAKPLPPQPPKQPATVAAAPKPKAAPKQAEPVAVIAGSSPPVPADAAEPPADSKSLAATTPTAAASADKAAAPSASPAPSQDVVAQAPPAAKAEPPAAREPAPTPPTAKKEAKPAKTVLEHQVVLLGYSTNESAQSEIKALQLLGFRTKDAQIVADPKGGFTIRLAQMKSKDSAEEMVSSLARMSFRAVVQTVQR